MHADTAPALHRGKVALEARAFNCRVFGAAKQRRWANPPQRPNRAAIPKLSLTPVQ